MIFQGKNMQSTWFRDEALPNTFYGKSENGKNTTTNEQIGDDVMRFQYIFLFHSRLDGHRRVL